MAWTVLHTREGDVDITTVNGSDAHGRALRCRVVRNTVKPIRVQLELDGKVILDGEWPSVRSTGCARALVREDDEIAALAELLNATEQVREALFLPAAREEAISRNDDAPSDT